MHTCMCESVWTWTTVCLYILPCANFPLTVILSSFFLFRFPLSFFFLPGKGPFPGIIDLFGVIGGLVEFRASLLASHGFAVLALAYFAYKDLPEKLQEVDLEYFEEAANFLLSHPKVLKINFISSCEIIGKTKSRCLIQSVQSWAEHSLCFKSDRIVELLTGYWLLAYKRQKKKKKYTVHTLWLSSLGKAKTCSIWSS